MRRRKNLLDEKPAPILPEIGGREITFEEASKAKKRSKPSRSRSRKAFEDDVARGIAELEPARALVVFHTTAFKHVYGVLPTDVVDSYVVVCASARGLLREFDDDLMRALEYLKWAWRDDERKKRWLLREKGEGKAPPPWRRFFVARDKVDAYRAEALRLSGQK